MNRLFASKRIFTGVLLAGLFSAGFAQQQPVLQLVESIPEETILDNPDIPNAPEVWAQMIQNAQSTWKSNNSMYRPRWVRRWRR